MADNKSVDGSGSAGHLREPQGGIASAPLPTNAWTLRSLGGLSYWPVGWPPTSVTPCGPTTSSKHGDGGPELAEASETQTSPLLLIWVMSEVHSPTCCWLAGKARNAEMDGALRARQYMCCPSFEPSQVLRGGHAVCGRRPQ